MSESPLQKLDTVSEGQRALMAKLKEMAPRLQAVLTAASKTEVKIPSGNAPTPPLPAVANRSESALGKLPQALPPEQRRHLPSIPANDPPKVPRLPLPSSLPAARRVTGKAIAPAPAPPSIPADTRRPLTALAGDPMPAAMPRRLASEQPMPGVAPAGRSGGSQVPFAESDHESYAMGAGKDRALELLEKIADATEQMARDGVKVQGGSGQGDGHGADRPRIGPAAGPTFDANRAAQRGSQASPSMPGTTRQRGAGGHGAKPLTALPANQGKG